MYLLDTNIVSHWMRGDPEAVRWLKERPPSDLAMSAITLAAILYGIARSPTRKAERGHKIQQLSSLLRVYPFDEGAAEDYAVVRSELDAIGQAISERDTQIAAIALARRLTVVTHNVREFGRVTGLAVEDWALPR